MTEFVIDSRFRLQAGEHSFVSQNTSSDFVIQLPQTISQFVVTKYEIPLSYYVINANYNTLIFRVPPPYAIMTPEYFIARIAPGTYDSTNIAAAVQTALNNAVPLYNETLGLPPFVFTVAYLNFPKKLQITAPAGGIQFITTPSTTAPGIPLGDIYGFPSEMVANPTPDPTRYLLNNCAKILGIPMNTVLPNPDVDIYGFPLGQQFGFDIPAFLPFLIDLSGENYMYMKTDLAGITTIRQAVRSTLSVNENDFTVIQANSSDSGIVCRFQISQSPYSKLMGDFSTGNTSTANVSPNTIKLQAPTNTINFRLSFQSNLAVDLNGVDISFTIYGK